MSANKHDADGDLHEVVDRLIEEQRVTRRKLDRLNATLQRNAAADGLSVVAAVDFYVQAYEKHLEKRYHLISKLKKLKTVSKQSKNEDIFCELLKLIEWLEDEA